MKSPEATAAPPPLVSSVQFTLYYLPLSTLQFPHFTSRWQLAQSYVGTGPPFSSASSPVSASEAESDAAKKKPKTSAAQIRVQKDLTELELPSTMTTHFPDPTDLLNFTLNINPDEGMYKGGSFIFNFVINLNYPHEPPKVKCTQKIYHPNVDIEGNVCLNILREDWKPVLNLNAVIVGLQYLFLEPNADDPLNKEAANDLRNDRVGFEHNVKNSMNGRSIRGTTYDVVTSKRS
ncbi:hypothetical protein PCANC_25656 [Puccinia coronata f. sp. avenae]|uniref:NEDD8-conjugating enzyme UBC12 n=1 Tax=Puccinia coronata f. sp. avenae TaxID=200324 RepID=A0A2N5SCA3_9BASI|nr:hypothetical protein PCANC_25656 [Puccinia coronata f. sp. avenae]